MFVLPEYTSPPLLEAVEATPEEWRSDEAIQVKREVAAANSCGSGGESAGAQEFCQLSFPGHTTTGVILYGGAMMDPRSYSPLARILQAGYGFTVVVPVFPRDLAWDYQSCSTGRVELARSEFPHIDRWILAGHSFGAIAASLDLWALYSSSDGANITGTGVQGMVFMAADARGDLGCGSLDFSTSGLPFASLTASSDQVLNATRYLANRRNLPDDTFYLQIVGGNHENFGSSNFSLRSSILSIQDGHATVSQQAQQEAAATAIANVAARAGWTTPIWETKTMPFDAVVFLLLFLHVKGDEVAVNRQRDITMMSATGASTSCACWRHEKIAMPVPRWLQENCSRLLANDASLTNLNLNIRRLDDSDLQLLAESMMRNSTLQILNLTSTLTRPGTSGMLIDTPLQQIMRHASLKVLHLSYNHLGSVSAALSSESTSRLSELHLDHNRLENPEHLFHSLRHNSSLKVLQLNCNRVCDDACRVLADVLATNSVLEVLGLRRNCITPVGAASLEHCLAKSNMMLRQLELDENNGISDQQLRRIEIWCDANRLGRRWWQICSSPELLPCLWPFVIARMSGNADILRLFLKARSDVVLSCKSGSTNFVSRKRGR